MEKRLIGIFENVVKRANSDTIQAQLFLKQSYQKLPVESSMGLKEEWRQSFTFQNYFPYY